MANTTTDQAQTIALQSTTNNSSGGSTSNAVKSQSCGAGITNESTTYSKIDQLRKKGLTEAASAAEQLFLGKTTAGTSQKVDLKNMDRYTKNLFQTLFSVEIKTLANKAASAAADNSFSSGIQRATSSAVGGINAIEEKTTNAINSLGDQLKKNLEPISSATGQTLATLTNVVKDPTGALFSLGESLVSVVDKVSPGFSNRLDASLKKIKADDLMNLPGQLYGSLKNLASLVDSLLAFPLGLIEDIYQGLMEIMNEISELLDSIVSSLFELLFDFLDSLFPIKDLLEFLDACSSLLGTIGSITGSVTGLTQVTNMVSMGQSYISQATSVISNPMSLASAYMPSQVSEITGYLRNPQGLIDQMIPSDITNLLGQIGNVPGLGLSGNLGYGLEGIFSQAKQGFATSLLNQFENQLGIIKPLLGQSGSEKITNNQRASEPSMENSLITGKTVIRGTPVSTTPTSKVLPETTDQ